MNAEFSEMLFSICLCSRCCKGNNCFIPVSCPCLSIFVLVVCVVLVSSYRLCCLPFPSCSVFCDGWLMCFLMGGCVCACVPLLVFSVLPSFRLSVVCAPFIPVVMWFLIPFGIHCLLPVVLDCVFVAFVVVPVACVSFLCCCSWLRLSVGFCIFVCVRWSFLMGGRF